MSVSVIIPCYNSEQTIERAIYSVVKQLTDEDELIIVDNQSIDNSVLVIKELIKHLPHIKMFVEHKKGAPAARNKGLKQSNGKYVLFLDADDELKETFLEERWKFVSEGVVDIIIGGYTQVKGTIEEDINIKEFKNPIFSLFFKGLSKTSAVLFKRSKLIELGGWNEAQKLSQEYELMFRMLKKRATIRFIDDNLVKIFEDNVNSLSRNKQGEAWDIFLALRYDIWNYLAIQHRDEFEHYKMLMSNYIFEIIRRLYNYDEKKAIYYFEIFFKKKHTFNIFNVNSLNLLYQICFSIFGFRITQQVWQRLKNKIS